MSVAASTGGRVAGEPIRVALVNDYEVVLQGLSAMFAEHADRVVVVSAVANEPTGADVDIALFDTFAMNHDFERELIDLGGWNADRLVVYSWNLDQQQIKTALRSGVAGYLDKRLTSVDLIDALERIRAGETVVTEPAPMEEYESGDWPGRRFGLTPRESEIIALITQGLSNQDIADRAYLSINSVKSYIRSSYRKMGVTSRSRAVLWGIEHGFRPDRGVVHALPGERR